ncbi:MAG: glycosyltransferase family 2 protein [Christensenellales bacterium]
MISIVMPCYNCETSLARTVRCVQAQTVSDWELIAVDDGSTDGTGAALDGLAQNDARIRAIHQANGGVSRARNIGMAAAGGEWLAFVDADDVLPPDALQTLLALDDGVADILCGAYTIRHTDEGGREEVLACADGDRQTVLESLVRTDSTLNSMRQTLSRQRFGKRLCVPPGVKVGEDVLFNLDAFYAAHTWRMTDVRFMAMI